MGNDVGREEGRPEGLKGRGEGVSNGYGVRYQEGNGHVSSISNPICNFPNSNSRNSNVPKFNFRNPNCSNPNFPNPYFQNPNFTNPKFSNPNFCGQSVQGHGWQDFANPISNVGYPNDPHLNQNIPSHHFDPWHGTPIRNDGVGYRDGPPGGPYEPGGPPGSYSLEPLGYYHSQLPARPIPNSRILTRHVPNSQVGSKVEINTAGYNPKLGETYHPHMADPYSVPTPVIPVRPGVYPSPVSYDGYYGPSLMSFYNFNQKDTPKTETVPPHVYNRFSNQHACPNTGKFPTRAVIFGPGPTMVKEQTDSDQFSNAYRGSYKVLLKQHHGGGKNDFDDNNEYSPVANMHHSEKGSSRRKPMRENDWKVDHRKNEPEDISKSVNEGERVLPKGLNGQLQPSLLCHSWVGLYLLQLEETDVALLPKWLEALAANDINFSSNTLSLGKTGDETSATMNSIFLTLNAFTMSLILIKVSSVMNLSHAVRRIWDLGG